MPSLDFSVYCGICGSGICRDTEVDKCNNVTITCGNCQDNITQLAAKNAQLENELYELKQAIQKIKI